jgi:hypothetical protein
MRFQIRPKLRSKLTPVLAALALSACVAPAAFADVLNTPATATGQSGSRPARGMSMEKVEATFGTPSSRVPAVGEPPISRWEYPGFTVYFEHHLVIHTVAAG